ncbi:LuxR C-terminal-related transcriptional regulator [Bacillus pinisoli]|uniref:LuxR C-terminal-related transcriptional regulator n=1 Tax=Bacillus pinisoli TaxID=2901866 RepID=UPI001FF339AC|nr:LuxR C-terminal-related transcriptional regulator [Bacillus pinisoli]
MNIVNDLIDAYSVHMHIPLLLIKEDGSIQLTVNLEENNLVLIKASNILEDLLTVGRLIKRPTILTPTNEEYASLQFMLSPLFKLNNQQFYILGGPIIEEAHHANEDLQFISRINKDEKLRLFEKMQTLTTIIDSFEKKEVIEDSQLSFGILFDVIRNLSLKESTREQISTFIFNELVRDGKIDLIGFSYKNNEDIFVIESVSGEGSEALMGKKFHIGEGILGQAVVAGQNMVLSNISNSNRFSIFHQDNIYPSHFFSIPIKSNEDVVGIYFGGTFGNQPIHQRLIDFIEFSGFFIQEQENKYRLMKEAQDNKLKFESILDLLNIFRESVSSRSMIYSLLDFSTVLNNQNYCCFTFSDGEFISCGEVNNAFLTSHNEAIKSGKLGKVDHGEYVIIHYSIYVDNEINGILTVPFSNRLVTEESYSIYALDTVIDLLKNNKEDSVYKTNNSSTNPHEKLNIDDVRDIVDLELEDIENMVNIGSVIEQLPLTSREKEILRLLLEGLNNQEVASYLNISVHTVKNHITNIYKKLNVTDRVQAMTKIYRIKYGEE